MMIHKTAYIDKKAHVAKDVIIGEHAFIGKNVFIGEGSKVYHHASIQENTKIGKNCNVWPFASVGSDPQDLSYNKEDTYLEIGDNCTIRESVTISRGTKKEEGITRIGNNVLIMASAHIGHDCLIGNNVVIANFAGITGHVRVSDHVIIGGLSGIHQFTRIGEGAIISGGTMCNQDIFPFSNAQGDRASIRGLNTIGMRRRYFSDELVSLIKKAYKIYFCEGLTHEKGRGEIELLYKENPRRELKVIYDFLNNSKRGLARPSQKKHEKNSNCIM